MGQIDTIGTYILEVAEIGLTVTREKKYPQLVLRSKAVKKWVDDAETMAHFGITAPAYVDWSGYNEDSLDYLVLFNSPDTFDESTAMLNYEQAQKAFGWAGAEFANVAKAGDQFLGRFKQNEYNGKTSIQLSWIDHVDADPINSIKTLAVDEVAALSKLLKQGIGKAAKPAAAKPTTKPKPGAAAAPKSPSQASSPAQVATAAKPDAGSVTAPATPPTTAPKSPSKPPASTPPKAEAEPTDGLAREVDQTTAWDYVIGKKGGNEDSVIVEAWLAACAEVGNGRQEAQFTNADWGKIRDIVLKDLAL